MDPSSTREGYFDPPSGGKDDRLRELELRYRGIIDQLPAVLYVDGVNEHEPMIDVSPSVIDLLGIPRERFLSPHSRCEQRFLPIREIPLATRGVMKLKTELGVLKTWCIKR